METTIVWTKHAENRQREWERKLGITRSEVEDVLRNAEQVVAGDINVRVAQARKHGGVLRVAFVEEGERKKVITVYWTSKVQKYWREK